jgi:phosphate transport system permease protein
MAESSRRRVPRSVRIADRLAGLVLGIGGSFAPFALAAAMLWLFWQADLLHPLADWSRVGGWLRGSVSLGLVALAGASPFAVTGALLGRGSDLVRLHLRMVAAVPLAVPAFLLLHWTAPWVSQRFGLPVQHPGWACIALAVGMVPPLWLILSDALERGGGISAAAYALGATPSQVMRTLILPASAPGLVAALLRGFSRAMGETMAVLLVSGNYASAWGGAGGAATVGAALVLDLPEAIPGGALWIDLMRGGLLLTVLTVSVYAVSDRVERRFRSGGQP